MQVKQLSHRKRLPTFRQGQHSDAPAPRPKKRAKFHQFQLSQLPDDCLNHIFSFCSARDLCSLRQTCRHFKNCIYPSTWRTVFASLGCSCVAQSNGLLRSLFFLPVYLSEARSALAAIDTIPLTPVMETSFVLIGFSLCCKAVIHNQGWQNTALEGDTRNRSAQDFYTVFQALTKDQSLMAKNMRAINQLCITLIYAEKKEWSVAGCSQLVETLVRERPYVLMVNPPADGLMWVSRRLSRRLETAWDSWETWGNADTWRVTQLYWCLINRGKNLFALEAAKSIEEELHRRAEQAR